MNNYSRAVDSYFADTSEIKTAALVAAAKRLTDQVAEIEEVVKHLKAVRDNLKQERIPQRFTDEEIKTLTVLVGNQHYRVTVSQLTRCSIKSGMKEDAFAWLRAEDLDDIIQETVNSGTLSALAANRLKENKEMDDDIFNLYFQPSTSFTKTAKG